MIQSKRSLLSKKAKLKLTADELTAD